MAKHKKNTTKTIIPLFLLIAILIVGFIYLFNRSQVQDIRSKALFEDNPNFCQESCIGKDRCSQSSSSNPGDSNYNDPCCEEIKKTGDPGACPWPQRGYCTDDQCSAIPGGVSRERCGGPRHSWCNECISHNCPGYTNNPPIPPPVPTSIPIVPSEVPPTSVPIPTEVPTFIIVPTTQVIQITRPAVTYNPVVYPTNPPPPILTPTSKPFNVSLPNLLPAKEKVEVFIQKTKFSILDFLSKILP